MTKIKSEPVSKIAWISHGARDPRIVTEICNALTAPPEITPEMIEAGAAYLWAHPSLSELGPTDCEIIAREVWLTMRQRAYRERNKVHG